jgi:hypothetical protein
MMMCGGRRPPLAHAVTDRTTVTTTLDGAAVTSDAA